MDMEHKESGRLPDDSVAKVMLDYLIESCLASGVVNFKELHFEFTIDGEEEPNKAVVTVVMGGGKSPVELMNEIKAEMAASEQKFIVAVGKRVVAASLIEEWLKMFDGGLPSSPLKDLCERSKWFLTQVNDWDGK